nr:recombinase family protein [Sphingomonas sp. PP-CE-1A-559]
MKLDRLRRSAIVLCSTVEMLALQGARVRCLALGGIKVPSAAGRITMGVAAAAAECARSSDRTDASRAKAAGMALGRQQRPTMTAQEEM